MFRTTPYTHQREAFEFAKDLDAFGLWWEPGLGKTKTTLDLVAHHWRKRAVDALVVIAPNGVHEAWVADEIPTHLGVGAWVSSDALVFHSHTIKSKDDKAQAAHAKRLLKHNGLAILTMSYDAVITKRGKKILAEFKKKRQCALVLDEVTRIKTPGAHRTKTLQAAAKHAVKRYALTGTPVTNSVFDLYSILKFLDPNVWGGRNFEAFKTRYGEFVTEYGKGRSYEKLVGYKNLEKVKAQFHRLGDRRRKEGTLDLPPKVYSQVYYHLTAEQKKLLKTLKEELYANLEEYRDQEQEIALGRVPESTTALAIQLMVRAQQICSGYIKDDDGTEILLKSNPRLSVFREVVEDINGQAIVWAKYRHEISDICELLGDRAVRYDGAVPDPKDRRKAIEDFRAGKAQFFVANPAAASTGLTLTEASTVVYYSNSFKLEERLQSEDRCHRIGQTKTVNYIDIVGKGTVDVQILKALKDKRDVGAEITGDELVSWL